MIIQFLHTKIYAKMKSISYSVILMLCIPIVSCFKYSSTVFDTTMSHERLLELISNAEMFASRMLNESQVAKNVPQDCTQREKWKKQPILNKSSHLKKCCPFGESFDIVDNGLYNCHSSTHPFNPNYTNVVLYDNCIEDTETPFTLPYEIGNPCNTSILFNNNDDIFYVLQDGSLLLMDEFSNNSYSIEDKYCIDTDNISGNLYAIVCITSVEEHLNRSQVVAIGILMLLSIPCLLIVSCLHVLVKELRSVHGISLSLMAFCLTVGFLLHSLAHIFDMSSTSIGYTIQWFILSYFCWFLCICINVFINIWFYIPLRKQITNMDKICNFAIYAIISISLPTGLVILTIQKGFPGMPSYFIQGLTGSIRESQRYFIPPVSGILFLSFLIMTLSFFGFQKLQSQAEEWRQKQEHFNNSIYFDETIQLIAMKYAEVKKDAKCISLLLFIMITTWLLEVVTFYSPSQSFYLILMEMVNGSQGVFILLIFLVVRHRRTVIVRWWCDRGSHSLETIELSETSK